jgi:hypothetical protein
MNVVKIISTMLLRNSQLSSSFGAYATAMAVVMMMILMLRMMVMNPVVKVMLCEWVGEESLIGFLETFEEIVSSSIQFGEETIVLLKGRGRTILEFFKHVIERLFWLKTLWLIIKTFETRTARSGGKKEKKARFPVHWSKISSP